MNEAVDFKIVEAPAKPISMNPKKFGMWLFIASVTMLFMALMSAYIVRRAEGNWVFYELPKIFGYSTIIVILSSVCLQLAYFYRVNVTRANNLIVATFLLGIVFLAMQSLGMYQLLKEGHHFTGGNVSESFFFIFPWLHGLHILGGLVYLIIVFITLRKGSFNKVQMEMCTTYWHFLGLLWLYLFVFLTLLR